MGRSVCGIPQRGPHVHVELERIERSDQGYATSLVWNETATQHAYRPEFLRHIFILSA